MVIKDLREAIVNRQEDQEYIEEDLELVDEKLDAFRQYFNAVFEHVMGSESNRFLCNAGYMEPDVMRDKNMELDAARRSKHEKAIDACNILNRLCDRHGIEHLCPDVEKDGEKCMNRDEIAEFVGYFVYNVYQQGIGAPELDQIRGDRTAIDTAIDIAKEKGVDSNNGYVPEDAIRDAGGYDPKNHTFFDHSIAEKSPDYSEISEAIEDNEEDFDPADDL